MMPDGLKIRISTSRQESEDILVIRGDVPRCERLGQTEDQGTEHGARDGTDAAEHRCGKGLDACDEADDNS